MTRSRASVDPTACAPDAEVADHRGRRGDVDAGEVDRLVRLTFAALLRREPDRDTLLAYREGFANGSTFRDLVDDVIASEEYRSVTQSDGQRRATAEPSDGAASPGDDRGGDLQATVALLAARLAEKGCRLRLGPLAEANRGDCIEDRRRMRSLLATLSVLDRL